MPRIRAENVEAHKRLTRNKLLDAATKTFVAEGFGATSLSAIADAAGIPRTTVYRYFESKDELLGAVVEGRVRDRLEALVVDLVEEAPMARIEEIFRRTMSLATEEADLTYLVFRVGRELPKRWRDRSWAALGPVTAELFRLSRLGADLGLFGSVDPDRFAQILADVLVGGVDELTHAREPVRVFEDVLAARLAFVRSGLKA
ncbi:MAG: TetR/AcrR family transcriptional regulator [Acidimicrobiia bacterium]